MSTGIAKIKGLKESELSKRRVETNLCLTRFWGGAEKGRMLQLTVDNDEDIYN